MRRIFHLVHETARRNAISEVSRAPDGYMVTVQPPVRSLEQNAKFHAICDDVAKSGFKFGGKRRSKTAWKTLFISGHATATGEEAEIIPGLEGEFVNVRESSALMSKPRSASLIEYTLSWCAQNGIELN